MAAREEDKAMAGLLRRSLARDAGPGSGEECPKPEILAAYFDRALDAREIARYDLHFSHCSLCREQLAAMARAGDAPDAKDAEKKNAGGWDWLAAPRWLMPVTAALVTLLAITGIAWHMRKAVAPANEVAMTRPDALPPNSVQPANSPPPVESVSPLNGVPAPEAAPPAKVVPPATRENPVVPPAAPTPRDAASAAIELGKSRAARTSGATSAAGAKAGVSHANPAARREELPSGGGAGSANYATRPEALPQAQTKSRLKSPAMDREAMRAGNGGGVSAGAAHSTDATASAADKALALETTPVPGGPPATKTEAGSVESDTNAAVQADEAKEPNAAKTKLPETAAPSRSVTAMNLAASQMTEAAVQAKLQEAQISSNLMKLQIQTPDPKILWMVASPGLIEKSEDGGTTWKPEYSYTRALLLAGAAPTVKICWVVGANGTILRTTNGSHWKTITPPVEANFVRVEAADALTATVTTMDGRKFSTVDGGKSWIGVN